MRSGAALMPAVRGRRVAAVVAIAVACGAGKGTAQLHHGQLRDDNRGCTISATSVSFGNYDALSMQPTDSQGSITYSCGTQNTKSKGPRAPVQNIVIELSQGSSGSYDRAMSGGADRLRYNLYLDAARQTVWGDGSSGTDVLRQESPQNHQTYTVPVYGRIMPQQDVEYGPYIDTLIATIQW